MHPIEKAILRTIIYADIFDFPLTTTEIHHFLIHDTWIPKDTIQEWLVESPILRHNLAHHPPYYALCDRIALFEKRISQLENVRRLTTQARYYGEWLSRLPYVRMVAITGSLAIQNPQHPTDDLDYFILVEPGRVWLTRALAIVLVRLGRLRGVEICPNYILASNRMNQQRQDLYIAHEIAQMIPLYGLQLYQDFRQANGWANIYQPNATHPLYPQDSIETGAWEWLKKFGEWCLGGRVGTWAENWEYTRKQKRFENRIKANTGRAQISSQAVKGHFDDYGTPVLQQYTERLATYGVG